MHVEVRYDTKYSDKRLDESKKLMIQIRPSEASERALFDLLKDKGVNPTLAKYGDYQYPYIEIELDLS